MIVLQEDYQNQFLKISKLQIAKHIKVKLLSALLQQLKYRLSITPTQQQLKNKTIATEDTHYSDGPIDLPQQISEIEKKIIMKRDVKILLNEQIEDAEEQYEAMEKSVFLKQQLDDELKRKIDMKMFQIEVGNYQDKKKQINKPVKVNKTFSIFSNKVFDFFN